jgi:alpha-glucosidase (family GH31 glycosyl hydrolase)
MKVISIIDPGIKIEKNYEPYEDCLKENYFVLNKDKTTPYKSIKIKNKIK